MKAIIFAAGLGTRIQEISKGKPKALLTVNGEILLEKAINFLSENGVTELIVNIHHQSNLMKDFILNSNFPIPVSISDESDLLLDTGGGLLKARSFFNDGKDFIVFNVDIISNIDLQEMFKIHQKSNALATLAVRKRQTSRYLLFNDNLKMIGWENINTKEQILHHREENYQQFAFSGIHILSPQIFDLLEEEKKKAFSITKSYIDLSKNHKIQAYIHNQDYWFDVGKPESYKEACEFLKHI